MNKSTTLKLLIFTIISFSLMRGGPVVGQENHENLIQKLQSDSTFRILKQIESSQALGEIKIHQDNRLNSLMWRHIAYNDSIGTRGWKIEIYHGRDIKEAQDAGAKFVSVFPDLNVPAVVDYEAPDFRTLVGAFRTREEAYSFYQQIKSEFENSYLVRAVINPGELK